MSDQTAFLWQRCQEAEELLVEWLDSCCEANETIARLALELEHGTSSRLFDWVDHIIVPQRKDVEEALIERGFEWQIEGCWIHPGAQLPRVVWGEVGVAVSVDSIAQFLMVRRLSRPIEGAPYSPFRRCLICTEGEVALWVVERRGTLSVEPTPANEVERWIHFEERWLSRPRDGAPDEELLEAAIALVKEMTEVLGRDRAACLVCQCERSYWQNRNRAGQLQKARQDAIGMGWANHDHHTFRSSRHLFPALVHLFELLGFTCRERFYAGKEAGWGAQVMENRNARLVLFLDLDLSPSELAIDFAHQELPDLDHLGTIGLWCALHGDSILQSGMHHLEAQFLFDQLRDDLADEGIGMMQPFSDFSYLRQAFTEGERWPVATERLEWLVEEGLITVEQAEIFASEGAIGSHLENLQRREGFKGFNQKNVSLIIGETDPRKQ